MGPARPAQQLFDPATQRKIATFTLARLLLMSLVLLTTIFLKQEVLGAGVILQIYAVLAASFLFSAVSVSLWDQTLRVRYFIPSQLLYDLLLTSYLVYLTGVNESIFIFLYLLNILFSSVMYQLNGALLVAAASGSVYAFIYYSNVDTDSGAAFYNLAYSELLFLLTALLSGQFMDELKRQRTLLEAQLSDISRLELLNDHLLNSIPVGLVTVDENEYVEQVNQTALSLLGLTHTPTLRIKYYELLPELKGILGAWDLMTETQRLRFLFRHGETNPGRFSLQIAKLRVQGHHILVFQDASKLLELEQKLELESRLAATGELAAAIAHEIRNPLASISGSIEMLAQHLNVETEHDRKLMDISLREIRRLNTLITDFLEYAKPRNDKLDAFPLHEVVSEVADAVQSGTKNAGPVAIRWNIGENLRVHANRERIKQVFFNLFLNAIEAASGQPISISVQAAPTDDDMLAIDVIDNGPGIPPSVVKKIFDPFFTTKTSGTGLGLATVARIVNSAKGEIRVEDSPKGAHFHIRLPIPPLFVAAGSAS
jgi:two-component system, NtrC family, sensor histidine kinase PilS